MSKPTTTTTTGLPLNQPTPIPFTTAYWNRLTNLIHCEEGLRNGGYKMEQFKEEELVGLRRCRDCHVRIKVKKNKEKTEDDKGDKDKGEKDAGEVVETEAETEAASKTKSLDRSTEKVEIQISKLEIGKDDEFKNKDGDKDAEAKKKKKKTSPCQFHPGHVVDKHFICCQKHVSELGCVERDQHTAIDYKTGELEAEWLLHKTPTGHSSHTRKAIALDCEMGTTKTGDSELIRVSAIDYFTGEVLVDSLVYPLVPMQHLNTRYSGVSRTMLEQARRRGRCLTGRDEARQRVWRYVARETVVVMHGGQNDLLALRWIHGRVIDTFLVGGLREVEAKRSLKELTLVKLGEKIQGGGRRGHDSVEDAVACRGVCNWYASNVAW